MIERYILPEMRDLFADEARLQRWLDVELAVVDAWANVGVVSSDVAARLRAQAPRVDHDFVAAVERREAVTRHDVAAFVDVVAEVLGDDGRWFHYGLTSSDVVDTGLGVALARATELIVDAGRRLYDELTGLAQRHRMTAMVGRTHGVHAEPITLGAKLALLALQVARAIESVSVAAGAARVGKVSGAVGNHAHVEPAVEEHVCKALGLRPIASTQVIPRDVYAAVVFALARTASTVEGLAVQVRLGHQTEVGELREGFAADQKGSSAMPHKANPVTAEQLCGVARVVRAAVSPALENIALWHERDISHSSVERVMLPDAFTMVHYALHTAADMVANLVVDETRLAHHLAAAGDVISSQPLLLRLIDHGFRRDDAYRLVQGAVDAALENGTSLRDEAERRGVPQEVLVSAFDMERMLRHADRAVDQLARAWHFSQSTSV